MGCTTQRCRPSRSIVYYRRPLTTLLVTNKPFTSVSPSDHSISTRQVMQSTNERPSHRIVSYRIIDWQAQARIQAQEPPACYGRRTSRQVLITRAPPRCWAPLSWLNAQALALQGYLRYACLPACLPACLYYFLWNRMFDLLESSGGDGL